MTHDRIPHLAITRANINQPKDQPSILCQGFTFAKADDQALAFAIALLPCDKGQTNLDPTTLRN